MNFYSPRNNHKTNIKWNRNVLIRFKVAYHYKQNLKEMPYISIILFESRIVQNW